jgi:hypothetical protein
MKQDDAWLDGHLSAGLDQLRELVVRQALEQGERAQVVDSHQIR